jgi:hypothetical protein
MTDHFDPTERERFLETLWRCWGREVRLFRRPFSKPLANDAEFWEVLKGWAREVRAGRCLVQTRWIEENLLPSDADVDLASFCRRVDSLGPEDWCLYQADGAQAWSPLLWHRLTELVRPVIARVGGLPPGGMMLDLFLGRYDRTGTGIHRDEADVLAFVTRGPKRLYFWPRDRFEGRWATPDRSHFQTGIWSYEKHLDSALVVEAEAGDVIYWPRDYFHIGASPDHWSGMLTLTMWWQASAQGAVRYVVNALCQADGAAVVYPLELDALPAGARSLPPALRDAADSALSTLNARWGDRLAETWARAATAYGFVTPPGRLPVARADGDRYRVRHPIALVEIGGRRHVFACGHRLPAASEAGLALAERVEAAPVGETLMLPADPLRDALVATGAIAPV